MHLVLVDPSLEARSSHHYVYNAALAKEAVSRGWQVRIICHRRFPFDNLDGIPALRHFETNGYPELPKDRVRGHYDAFRDGNDALFDELAALPIDLFPPGALVLCPTVTEFQLYGMVRWAEIFPSSGAPQFVFWLMLQSGIVVDADAADGIAVREPLRALFYRLAMDRAKALSGRIAMFGSGPTHASEYSALSGTQVEPHPVLMSVDPRLPIPAGTDGAPRILLYAGDAKLDKGLGFVPELARRMRATHPDWTPVVHANFTTAWGPVLEVQKTIERLPLDESGVVATIGMVSAAEYTALYANAAAAVLSYDPAEYGRKSSGVLWETIAMGLPVVVPAGTWLEDEVRRWNGVYEAFESWTPDDIFAAISRLLPRAAAGRATMREAAERFAATNSAKAALDQLGDVWLRSAWLRSDLLGESDIVIGANAPGGRGWHDLEMVNGRPARWLSGETTIKLDLPPRLGWLVKLSGPKFVTPEAVEGIEVYLNDRLVDGSAAVEADWSGWRYTGMGWIPEGDARGSVTIRVKIPTDTAKAGDGRKLTVMLSEMAFGAPRALSFKDGPAPSCPVVFDRGQSARLKSPDGKAAFRIGNVAAGSTQLPVIDEAVLRFEIAEAGSEVLAGLQITANGLALEPQVQPSGAGVAVRARIASAALRRPDRRVEIEMVLPALTPKSRLRFSNPTIVVHEPRIELAGAS